jgi:hypothetical protein
VEPLETAPQPGPWSSLVAALPQPAPRPVSKAPSYSTYRRLATESPDTLDRRLAVDAAARLEDRVEPAPRHRLRYPASFAPRPRRLPKLNLLGTQT